MKPGTIKLSDLKFETPETLTEVESARSEVRLAVSALKKYFKSLGTYEGLDLSKIQVLVALLEEIDKAVHPEREIVNHFVSAPAVLIALSSRLTEMMQSTRTLLNLVVNHECLGPKKINPVIGEALALSYNLRFIADRIRLVLDD